MSAYINLAVLANTDDARLVAPRWKLCQLPHGISAVGRFQPVSVSLGGSEGSAFAAMARIGKKSSYRFSTAPQPHFPPTVWFA
jgi:hypothetical protein